MNFIVAAVLDLGHTIPCADYGRERKVRRLIPQGTGRENLLENGFVRGFKMHRCIQNVIDAVAAGRYLCCFLVYYTADFIELKLLSLLDTERRYFA